MAWTTLRMNSPPPESTTRSALQNMVPLTAGRCHFRLDGPEQGRLVLLLHGATVPGWEFDRLTPLLHEVGIRCLVPDLFGHGFSERPRRRYDYPLFEQQLEELLQKLSIHQPFDIVGHSMGAVIAARLARSKPDQVRRLVLNAPLLDFTGVRRWTRMLRRALVGEMLMSTLVEPMLMRRRRRRYQPIEDGRWVKLFEHQLETPGFGAMLLSMLRSGTLGDQSDAYLALRQYDGEVLLLRGECDDILTASQFERLRELMPAAKFAEIANAAHAAVITDPERVARHIVEFLD